MVSRSEFGIRCTPVAAAAVMVESIGVHPIGRRRVDVAVDLTPCLEPLTVEMVVVGPGDEELSSIVLVECRQWMLDKVMHLRSDAEQGEHILHVGVFSGEELVAHGAKRFTFLPPAAE